MLIYMVAIPKHIAEIRGFLHMGFILIFFPKIDFLPKTQINKIAIFFVLIEQIEVIFGKCLKVPEIGLYTLYMVKII